MKNYVVGFLFDVGLQHVVLIRKNRPEWQSGCLNGVGGHIEDGESPHDAMVREFREETGVTVNEWRGFCDHTWRRATRSFWALTPTPPSSSLTGVPARRTELPSIVSTR